MSKLERVDGLDTVRALAALSVAFAHIVSPPLALATKDSFSDGGIVSTCAGCLFTGHPAVVAFFVVSGFCIHYPFTSGNLPVFAFWMARLVRVLVPAIAAYLVAKLARINGYNFIDGYILWSIVCEIFYYACYPAFLFVSRWVGWGSQFLISLALSYVIVALLGSDEYGNAQIYGPALNWLVALPSWLIGCVLAERVALKNGIERERVTALGITLRRLGIAGLATLLCIATSRTPFGYYLTMNLFSLVVFLWVRDEISYGARQGWCDKTGKWSYSIYLLHMPLFVLLVKVSGRWIPLQFQPLLLFPALYGCFLFFRFIEAPSHRWARQTFDRMRTRGPFVVVKPHV